MPQTLSQSPQSLLREAAHGFLEAGRLLPSGKELTVGLLELERTAKQTKQNLPVEVLLGTWRLCFSAGKKAKFQSGKPVGSGFYVPKLAIARITFAADDTGDSQLKVTNELNIGPLKIRFTGPARYPGKKNLLAFDFTHLQVSCFGLTVYQGKVQNKKRADKPFEAIAIAQLPFFAFFAATDDYIAARGRGGGLAIWVKESS
ncbi:MAG: hypothetical protein AAGG53_12860 [Cyanobacteria bacterium P01_H01_bin.152]